MQVDDLNQATAGDPVAEYQQRVAEIAERAELARTRVAEIRPSVTSDDGAVTVSVTATGSLVGIEFGSTARDLELSDLAAKIMRTAQRARVRAAEETQQVLASLVGESSAAMDFVRSQLTALSDSDDSSDGATSGSSNPGVAADESPEDGYQGRGL
ncbi:YbaB/EbfC DNA-binding family protein [Frankineae bacterium MT45]|nr:YbaB/EbfC DNA-binding family protein [Frankineae bacterium MT45]